MSGPAAAERLEDAFVAQARRTPEALAVLHRGRSISYGELDARSNRLARHLAAEGVGPGARVGLCLSRSPDMVAAVLAVLKAGGAYVPLDPAYPAERLRHILADCAPLVLVTDEAPPADLAWSGRTLSLAREAAALAARLPTALARRGGPADPAYVIYTSGSTGAPKGVVLGHTATAFMRWARETFTAGELDRVAATTSLCFDPSVFELFAPLSCGGAVVLKADALEPFTADERPTLLNTVPSAVAALCRAGAIPASVAAVNVGGEPLSAALVRELYACTGVRAVYNHYGPTEATTCTTVALVPPDVADDPPLGAPIAGARVHLLDESGRAVAPGEVGEIHISGPVLAQGYLNRPDLTAERFCDGLLGPEVGRVYRTGDLARRTPAGELRFVGRRDDQVKVRGFRLELGEIEAALLAVPGVRAAAALTRPDPAGRPQLLAWAEAPGLDGADLRRALASRLPPQAVPSWIGVLDRLPLALTGKLDRKALAALPAACEAAPQTADGGSREAEAVCEIFRDVLRAPAVAPDQSFFELGGDSLSAVEAALRLEEVFGQSVPSALLHHAPSPSAVAEALEACRERPGRGLSLLRAGDGTAPPLFCVSDLFGRPISYLSLARRLAPGRAIYGLSPGPAEGAFLQERRIEVLTRALLDEIRRVQPRGPYTLVGYSAGGLPAFDLACALQREGEVARLVLLDCGRARPPGLMALGGWLLRSRRSLVDGRAWRGRMERVRRTATELGRRLGAELPEWLPTDRRPYASALIEAYRAYRGPAFRGEAMVVKALEREGIDDLLDHDGLMGWRSALKGSVTVCALAANHHSLMREPACEDLARTVEATLAAWSRQPASDAPRPRKTRSPTPIAAAAVPRPAGRGRSLARALPPAGDRHVTP